MNNLPTLTVSPQAGAVLMRNSTRIKDMIDALATGASLGAAAEFAGLRQETVRRWVQVGNQLLEHYDSSDDEPLHHEEKLMELAVEIAKATAEVEISAAQTVINAQESGDWKAAAWILERRFKKDWSSRSEVTGAEGGPVQVEDPGKKRERVETALDEISKRIREAEEGRVEVIDVEAED